MSLSICLFVHSETTQKQRTPKILRDDSPWGEDGFRLKNIWIRVIVRRKIEKKAERIYIVPPLKITSLFF